MNDSSIVVRIGGDERPLAAADAQWVHQSIRLREAAKQAVCIEVRFSLPEARMTLSTPGCSSGGGWRPPNRTEQTIIDLWNHAELSATGTNPQKLWGFLQKLRRYLGLSEK